MWLSLRLRNAITTLISKLKRSFVLFQVSAE